MLRALHLCFQSCARHAAWKRLSSKKKRRRHLRWYQYLKLERKTPNMWATRRNKGRWPLAKCNLEFYLTHWRALHRTTLQFPATAKIVTKDTFPKVVDSPCKELLWKNQRVVYKMQMDHNNSISEELLVLRKHIKLPKMSLTLTKKTSHRRLIKLTQGTFLILIIHLVSVVLLT